jgi:hypothetical protein
MQTPCMLKHVYVNCYGLYMDGYSQYWLNIAKILFTQNQLVIVRYHHYTGKPVPNGDLALPRGKVLSHQYTLLPTIFRNVPKKLATKTDLYNLVKT